MPVPVVTIAQMREWENATWASGQTGAEIIRQVGEKIARTALGMTRPGDAILILAGKGHNGDDARAAKEFLNDRRIVLLNVTDPVAALAEFQRRTGVPPVSDSFVSDGDRRDACPTLIIEACLASA